MNRLALALIAAGALYMADRQSQSTSIATGDPARDRYDAQLIAGWQRAGLPASLWRLAKTMAWRESIRFGYAHQVHRDGIGLGMYGIHRHYYPGDLDRRRNPARYTERQLLDDVSANAEVAARILVMFINHARGDIPLGVEKFNRGFVAKAAGGYAQRTYDELNAMGWA
jgi:hypothetical protein